MINKAMTEIPDPINLKEKYKLDSKITLCSFDLETEKFEKKKEFDSL